MKPITLLINIIKCRIALFCYLFAQLCNIIVFFCYLFAYICNMIEPIHKKIEHQLELKKPGEILFPNEFKGMGTEAAIKMSLSRLAKTGRIRRIAHGIYMIPKQDPFFGTINPPLEDIAKAIAKKEKIRIKPAGAYALNKLGLSTQVPTRLVYLTDGPRKTIHIGKSVILFKQSTPKKLALEGELSSLIIQALEEIDPNTLDNQTLERLAFLLQTEKPKKLQHDLKLAPAKVNDFIFKLLKTRKNDSLVKIK